MRLKMSHTETEPRISGCEANTLAFRLLGYNRTSNIILHAFQSHRSKIQCFEQCKTSIYPGITKINPIITKLSWSKTSSKRTTFYIIYAGICTRVFRIIVFQSVKNSQGLNAILILFISLVFS